MQSSLENVTCGVQVVDVAVMFNGSLLLSGHPVNVTCNIFINSFGSITETTMVSSPSSTACLSEQTLTNLC